MNDKANPSRGEKCRAFFAALAFFLGVTLLLSGVGSVAAQIAWQRDLVPWGSSDWQETQNFRDSISSTLRSFLTLGAGGSLGWYGSYEDEVMWDYYNNVPIDTGVVIQSGGGGWSFWEKDQVTQAVATPQVEYADSSTDSGLASYDGPASYDGRTVKPSGPDADMSFRSDKNILYYIEGGEGKDRREYTNAPGGKDFFAQRDDADYNFYLTFQNGKASIWKDGRELNVYGDGFYDGETGEWFVPGYDNFPAGSQLDGVSVYLAVRQTPSRYYGVNYESNSTYYSGSLYYIALRTEQTREFYFRQALIAGAGVVFLALWVLLRKSKALADRKIASWTVHVWTEVRFLAVLACALGVVMPGLANNDFIWSIRYGWEYEGFDYFAQLPRDLLRLALGNVPALIGLVWACWLIHNDHRYNPSAGRRGLFRRLRAKDLQRPVERRLSRNQAAGMAALALVLAALLLLCFMALNDNWFPALILLAPLTVGVICLLVSSWKSLGLAQDLGRLANQVEAVRAGDLEKPLVLPEDADLRATSESLNDIQAGMKAALAEQTKSERMKVELVSNVSHDLKTPLTSILSYAELLRQEDLPPAAADYARVIDEKAKRLKTMVEDVFDISKAAADQLPIRLERLDLAKLLRQTLADMESAIQAAPVTIKVELPADPVMIVADGKRLYRVFQNLIDNALRHALEGSRVYLTLEAGELARASLRNTSKVELAEGVDFTARFVRGDASRTDGGSGLGLSIAKSFTEACGGAFRVETVADFFTAVVEFPLADH